MGLPSTCPVASNEFGEPKIVVVDDGLPEHWFLAKVPETAKHCKVIDLEQHDVGVGVGRNTAIDAAETEFIFLLDDDQIVTPDLHLDRVYQRFMDYDLDILAVRQGDGGRPMLFSPLMNGTGSGCIEANANASAKPVGATWSATHF